MCERGTEEYKLFTILHCKFSFYSVHSSYVFLHKHKFRETQAPFQSLSPLRSTTHATGSVIYVCLKDMEWCSACEYHSPSTSLTNFFIIRILKWRFHTLPTLEVPRLSKESSAFRMVIINNEGDSHHFLLLKNSDMPYKKKMVISAAVGAKLKGTPVTQSPDVSTATSNDAKWPQVPENISVCIMLQTSTHLLI